MNTSKIILSFSTILVLLLNGCDSDSNTDKDIMSNISASFASTTSSDSVSSTSTLSSIDFESSSLSASNSSNSSTAQSSDISLQIDINSSESSISRDVISVKALIDANSALNSDLFLSLSKKDENLFYSSYSIFNALSMTYAGANNATKLEFEKILHFDENLSVHQSFKSLLSLSIYEYNTFNVANSLWIGTQGLTPNEFVNTLKDSYNTDTYFKDYINDAENARIDINTWVEDNTEQKIIDLLPSSSITDETLLVLVNALYFNGSWKEVFDKNDTDKNDTDKKDFYLSNSTTKEVDMMHLNYLTFNTASSDIYQMVELPYKENEFSMLIFLPKTTMSDLENTLFKISSPLEIKRNAHLASIDISLPKFKIKWGSNSLKNFLISKGMIKTFDNSLADFSNMYEGSENAYISDVYHQAFIEVNEEGAEAGAATAVTASPGSSVTPHFNVNHPFIFFIVDNKTGMIVFSGKVEDPSL